MHKDQTSWLTKHFMLHLSKGRFWVSNTGQCEHTLLPVTGKNLTAYLPHFSTQDCCKIHLKFLHEPGGWWSRNSIPLENHVHRWADNIFSAEECSRSRLFSPQAAWNAHRREAELWASHHGPLLASFANQRPHLLFWGHAVKWQGTSQPVTLNVGLVFPCQIMAGFNFTGLTSSVGE